MILVLLYLNIGLEFGIEISSEFYFFPCTVFTYNFFQIIKHQLNIKYYLLCYFNGIEVYFLGFSTIFAKTKVFCMFFCVLSVESKLKAIKFWVCARLEAQAPSWQRFGQSDFILIISRNIKYNLR